MPRWKALPEELDPRIREFADTLRRLVDRGGLGPGALADRTGYAAASWERYLDGRSPAPKGAVLALAEATGTDPVHLTTLWELAERAWSRAEKHRDRTAEAVRADRTRAVPGAPAAPRAAAPHAPGAKAGGPHTPAHGAPAPARTDPWAVRAPSPAYGDPAPAYGDPKPAHGDPAPAYGDPGPVRAPVPAHDTPARRAGRTVVMFFAGALGTLLVFAAALFLSGLGEERVPEPAAGAATDPEPAATPSLPVGVGCHRGACDGQDPHAMGCGGSYGSTVASTIVGSALVEVRYSSACGAAWARISRAVPGDTVVVTAAGATRSAAADGDGDAYTPMVVVPAGTDAGACATLRSGTTGCTAVP